jgi:heme/copper-type cytochrome/quinol oxidase subunit 4
MPASARMVPSAYFTFFAAIATGAATLIGLLFVAVSIRDQTIFGPKAIPGGEALAVSAFSGLVNSLVLSLLAIIPQDNIGVGAIILAVITTVSIVRLHARLHWARNTLVLGLAIVAYAIQLTFGILLVVKPNDSSAVNNLCYVVFATLIFSLQRAWSLLKGKHLANATGDPRLGHDLTGL